MEIRITSLAERDLGAAYGYYEDKVPGLGANFVLCVDATLAIVARSPQLFRKRYGNHRVAMVPRFPYATYFIWDETAGIISIRRILHFAQNAPAHLTV